MKTSYEEIVKSSYIGRAENPVSMNEILKKAEAEALPKAASQAEKILFIAVDVQQDFIEGGALCVFGATADIHRMTHFIYENADKISHIALSLDTHTPYQIFHPCWWEDSYGKSPEPFTTITFADVESGKWRPRHEPQASSEYLRYLENAGMKKLCIWPYHCIQGTTGAALENQFANMVYFHTIARDSHVKTLVKGTQCQTEFYGIIRPEHDPENKYINMDILNDIENSDKVIIAGEAMDYCVYESLRQILDYFKDREDIAAKIYVLADCMSSIQDRAAADKMYQELQSRHKIHIVRSTDKFL